MLRTLFHIKAGDVNWSPTKEELKELTGSFKEALLSDLGVVATRDGVSLDTRAIEVPVADANNEVHVSQPEPDAEPNVSVVHFSQYPMQGSRWQHYKGNIYSVLVVANLDADSRSKFVPTIVYKAIADNKIWSRPLSEWYQNFKPVGSV